MEEKDLKELAGQLMCPSGEKGVEVAKMMNATNSGMTYHSIDILPMSQGMKTLEIGPGNAAHLKYLFNREQAQVYTGLDISGLMVEEATRINQVFVDEGRASFVLYDGSEIPFEEGTFDAVFTVNTIYFWENPLRFLKEIKRVMKPGGSFALTFAEASFMETLPFTKYVFSLYSPEKVRELAIQSGFAVERTDTRSEEVQSKAGDLVERNFITFLLVK